MVSPYSQLSFFLSLCLACFDFSFYFVAHQHYLSDIFYLLPMWHSLVFILSCCSLNLHLSQSLCNSLYPSLFLWYSLFLSLSLSPAFKAAFSSLFFEAAARFRWKLRSSGQDPKRMMAEIRTIWPTLRLRCQRGGEKSRTEKGRKWEFRCKMIS